MWKSVEQFPGITNGITNEISTNPDVSSLYSSVYFCQCLILFFLLVLNQVLDLLCDRTDSRIYVCGDAKGMAKSVNETFVEILQTHRGNIFLSRFFYVNALDMLR